MVDITPDGSQKYMINSTDSGSENPYYSMQPPSDFHEQPRRTDYDKKLNAIENWANFTQNLLQLQKFKVQQQIVDK